MSIWSNKTVLHGKVLFSEVNDLFGLHLSDDYVDMIGGWIQSENMDIAMGDEAVVENYCFKILELEGYHVKSLEGIKMLLGQDR
ncbi:transporter associated domain-containing protein [Fictibacillus sp. 26RED30]|uniref:transporter associated domain-containing protein n=1 Tax=Fictibacillus sp. 26RED30 TaxID=2745877 RepID=UPI0018CF7554|nr:hypothetical protein [Fictibacillus sp. 26RED30]